ncbi:MAG: hypothetical protein P4M12_08795 [Gammaproteobacteria bacterium]|nr:hypothetical protein [Gammaproteobacteria bacterium]
MYSYAQITASLEHPPESALSPCDASSSGTPSDASNSDDLIICLDMDTDLAADLKKNFSSLKINPAPTVEDLISEYTEICKLEKEEGLLDNQKLLLEDYKLTISLSLEAHLNLLAENNKKFEEQKKENLEKNSKLLTILKMGAFGFLFLGGIFLDFVANILGSESLLTLIPGIANPIVLGVALGISLVNIVVFIGFQASMLRETLGITSIKESAKSLLDKYDLQIESANNINQLLDNYNVVSKVSDDKYKKLVNLSSMINNDLQIKQERLDKYKEKPWKKAARHAVNLFSVVTVAGGAYFFTTSLLAVVAVGLLGTPVGWVLAGLSIAISVAYYFSMQAKGVYNIFNPQADHLESIKKNLGNFTKEKCDEKTVHLNKIIANKKAQHVEKMTSPPPASVIKRPTLTLPKTSSLRSHSMYCGSPSAKNAVNAPSWASVVRSGHRG